MKYSIVIVTRNRGEELFSIYDQLLQLDGLEEAEILVVDNGSHVELRDKMEKRLSINKNTRLILLEENLGVSGGRNIGLKNARGEYIIEIDDDAFIEDLAFLEKVYQAFINFPYVGILAFQIINYYSKQVVPMEYPFKDKRRPVNQPGYTSWFIGCCHAFRKCVLEKVGLPDFYPWGSEEPDLSFRAIDGGFKIYYYPEIKVYHKKSENARFDSATEFYSIALKNRIKLAALNLPIANVFSVVFVRGIQFTFKHKSFLIFPRALGILFKERKYIYENRKKIKPDTISYIKSVGGNLWR